MTRDRALQEAIDNPVFAATFWTLKFYEFDYARHARVFFPNGYGASVIRGEHTYGGSEGYYEMAVLDHAGLVYDTPVADDVMGWLTIDEVTKKLKEISELPAKVGE